MLSSQTKRPDWRLGPVHIGPVHIGEPLPCQPGECRESLAGAVYQLTDHDEEALPEQFIHGHASAVPELVDRGVHRICDSHEQVSEFVLFFIVSDELARFVSHFLATSKKQWEVGVVVNS